MQYKSTDKYCSHTCFSADKNAPSKKVSKPIPQISKKRLSELAIYRPLRDKYLAEHPICEVKGCGRKTDDLHHKAKRGSNLSNVDTFMAVCRTCHIWIHTHPEESRMLCYLI